MLIAPFLKNLRFPLLQIRRYWQDDLALFAEAQKQCHEQTCAPFHEPEQMIGQDASPPPNCMRIFRHTFVQQVQHLQPMSLYDRCHTCNIFKLVSKLLLNCFTVNSNSKD